jgi:hypothetical protein
MAVAGNKSDLADRRVSSRNMNEIAIIIIFFHKAITTESALEYSQSIGAIFAETSAKDDTNVEKIFGDLIRSLPSPVHAPVKQVVTIVPSDNKGKGGCCG